MTNITACILFYSLIVYMCVYILIMCRRRIARGLKSVPIAFINIYKPLSQAVSLGHGSALLLSNPHMRCVPISSVVLAAPFPRSPRGHGGPG